MTAGSYGLLDLKMETTSNKDTRFFLELTNVTNTDYIESGWVQMPGRWIKIGVTVKVKK
jgi:iron complex outermembrane receptor protein